MFEITTNLTYKYFNFHLFIYLGDYMHLWISKKPLSENFNLIRKIVSEMMNSLT